MEIVNDNWFMKTDENNQLFSHKQERETLKLVLRKKSKFETWIQPLKIINKLYLENWHTWFAIHKPFHERRWSFCTWKKFLHLLLKKSPYQILGKGCTKYKVCVSRHSLQISVPWCIDSSQWHDQIWCALPVILPFHSKLGRKYYPEWFLLYVVI